MAGTALVARHRTESAKSIESLTPADELSSWLDDDVCANCGAAARASHLYCSQQCKDEDAKNTGLASVSAPAPGAAASYFPSPPSVAPSNAAPVDEKQASRFRYTCPPSPNILARYHSSLTSPALVALEQSLPTTTSTVHQTSTRSMSSSGESSNGAQQTSKRRSSSRSTFSSASDILSTDLSTPSPASNAALPNEEEEDEFEPSDLYLPPSIHPAASILLNSSAREARSTASTSSSITPDGSKRSPVSKVNSTSAFKPGTVKKEERKTLDFARRPSTTNVPPPVLFTSPVLATTAMRSGEVRSSSGSFNSTHRHRSSGHGKHFSQDLQARQTRKGSTGTVGRSRNLNGHLSGPAIQRGEHAALYDAVTMRSNLQHGRPADSPPLLASACSSAGKTLRADSPVDRQSPEGLFNAVCGRYGCAGLGSSAESMEETMEMGRGSAPTHRPTFTRGHKHTHSAAAGLNLLGQAGHQSLAAKSKLLMTPVTAPMEKMEAKAEVVQERRGAVVVAGEERTRSPGRGRSKARGQRSTSRRSPSPPRGAARRGQSEDLTAMAVASSSQSSASFTSASHRSNPIALSPKQERRGRSPTERGHARVQKSPTGPGAGKGQRLEREVSHPCEMAWPAYGHHLPADSGDAKHTATATSIGTKGYDDIDLDEL